MWIKNALAWMWVEDLYYFQEGKKFLENYYYITELIGCELKYSWIHEWEKLVLKEL